MNEVYEALTRILEELRCESDEREYVIQPNDLKEAENVRKAMEVEYQRFLEKQQPAEKSFLEQYQDAVDHVHFKEEQRAYYQGIMDGIQMLDGLGLISRSKSVLRLIERLRV